MAAITAKASTIVTNDRRLRRQILDLKLQIRAMSVDEFATELLRTDRTNVEAVLADMAAKRTKPHMSVDDLVDRMEPRLTTFARAWRRAK